MSEPLLSPSFSCSSEYFSHEIMARDFPGAEHVTMYQLAHAM